MTREPVLNLVCMSLSEEEEQKDLLDKCARNEHLYPELGWLYHVPNGTAAKGFSYTGRSGKQIRVCPEGKKMKALGVKRGVPDLALDVAKGGYHGLRIEMKTATASPSDVDEEQRQWHTWLRERGFCVAVCKGAKAAWTILIWYLSLAPTQVRPNPADPPPVPMDLQSRRKAA